MEEASALANNVGILAKRMLGTASIFLPFTHKGLYIYFYVAIGTFESLSAHYGTYEVQFTCRTREEIVKARNLMKLIPGAHMADDVATRFEVPITQDGLSLAELFKILSAHEDFAEYTVERASLESVFLKVIKENDDKMVS